MTGLVSTKNFLLTPAASDLGLVDQLTQTLADQAEERRKKTAIELQQASGRSGGDLSPASLLLFGKNGDGNGGGV